MIQATPGMAWTVAGGDLATFAVGGVHGVHEVEKLVVDDRRGAGGGLAGGETGQEALGLAGAGAGDPVRGLGPTDALAELAGEPGGEVDPRVLDELEAGLHDLGREHVRAERCLAERDVLIVVGGVLSEEVADVGGVVVRGPGQVVAGSWWTISARLRTPPNAFMVSVTLAWNPSGTR